MPSTLLLFDIDGTLIDSHGAGLTSLRNSLAKLHNIADPNSIELDLAGSTDRSIFAEFANMQHFILEDHPEAWQDFTREYLIQLEANLANIQGKVLPGIPELLNQLQAKDQFHLSLLTGNLRKGAELKLGHYQLASHFDFESGAWGGETETRNQLGPIAIERASQHTNQAFSADNTWIIGDTPRDIACARACGARCLAVATGKFNADQLQDADHTLNDLTDTQAVLDILSQ